MKAIEVSKLQSGARTLIPLFAAPVSCGKPLAVDDLVECRVDLNRFLIHHPGATYFVRAAGDSMSGCRIEHNDILIVDRAAEVEDGDIVVARIDDEMVIKRFTLNEGIASLVPENDNYKSISLTEEMDFEIWGKVIHVIHSL